VLAFTAFVAEMAGVMEHLPCGVLIALDRAGKLVIGNQAAREILGLRPDQNVSSDMPMFLTPHAGVPVRSKNLPLHRALELGHAIPVVDYEIPHPDGTSRFVTMSAGPLYGDRGELQGAVATLTDVTYLRTQERRMRLERDGLTHVIAREQHVAQTLQKAHLPQKLPFVPGFRLSGMYHSPDADGRVGGDWYDAFRLRDGRIGFSIGDVMGSGLGAAVTMGKLRQAMQSVAFVRAEPSLMLDAANATLAEHDTEGIATAVAGILDPADATLIFAAAGHPLPMLRTSEGMLVAFEGTAPPLGVYEEGNARNHFAQLNPGDLAVFYTDGLIEATRDADVGERNLRRALLGSSPSDSQNSAQALHRRMLGKARCPDDVAILTVAREIAA
jgi:sigma-B regulation protein RsbU (phosphoserine phosphatase)